MIQSRLLRCLSSALALAAAVAPVASAADLTPAAAEALALRSNRDLMAARLRIAEAEGRRTAAGRRPNPEIQVESGLNLNGREGGLTVGWVQKFPKAARLRLEKEVSRTLVEAAAAEVQVAERQLRLNVRTLAVKAQAVRAEKALRLKQAANAKALAAFLLDRARTGEVSGLEATQIELEAEQAGVEALALEAEEAAIAGELRPLLGLGTGEPVTIVGNLAAPQVPGRPSGVDGRPEIRWAALTVAAAQKTLALEEARRREDVSAGFFAGWDRTEDAPDGIGKEGVLGLRLTVPLPLWNRNEGKIAEARATADRAAAEKVAAEQRLRAENAVDVERLHKLAAVIARIDGTLLPRAAELEAKLRASHKAGLTPLTDVVRTRERHFQLEKSRLAALREFHLIRASLGDDLP